jgi:hypothetical protein
MTGIGSWSDRDIVALLADGTTPDQTHVTGSMKEVVADGTKFLSEEDRKAIALYLKAQRPIVNKISESGGEADDRPWYQRWWDWLVAFFSWS